MKALQPICLKLTKKLDRQFPDAYLSVTTLRARTALFRIIFQLSRFFQILCFSPPIVRVNHLALSPPIPPSLGRLSLLLWDLWINPTKVGIPALHLHIIFYSVLFLEKRAQYLTLRGHRAALENLFHSHSGSAWSSHPDLLGSLTTQLKNRI